ncbi:unnamed protein product [Haemonchus placei]|uniref:DB domain-containing protein n=1 Tax=Haemonchus placei TaxID=6290 RepID=A0A0N4WF10_HAEPC|nr:unnamed protein product [Haemonchus placei]
MKLSIIGQAHFVFTFICHYLLFTSYFHQFLPNITLRHIKSLASLCISGCGIGYSCGAYGCYRSRARVHGANTVRDGPILRGADRFSQFRRPTQTSDPNVLFMDCCEQRGLPDACLRHCTYNTFRKESLIRMYFKQDACPIQATAEIQFCAAQGRDHRACCERNGVTTTLAGAKCLTFCDQRPGNVTMLDMSYVPCYERFENMKACFWHDTVNRLKK